MTARTLNAAALLLIATTLQAWPAAAAEVQHPAAAQTAAGWTLDAARSRLAFVSTKNDAVTEVHRFTRLAGSVSATGAARLQIALDGVETGIAIRNERLRTLLFDTAHTPDATLTLDLDAAALRAQPAGDSRVLATTATLALHGQQQTLPAELRISRLGPQEWLVSTEAPVIVDAAAFGLKAGVEALREIAKLDAIALGVPVTASLVFSSQPGGDARQP